MAEPHDDGEIPELGDIEGDLPMEYEGFEPISPGTVTDMFIFFHELVDISALEIR